MLLWLLLSDKKKFLKPSACSQSLTRKSSKRLFLFDLGVPHCSNLLALAGETHRRVCKSTGSFEFDFDFDASIMAWMCRSPPPAVGGKKSLGTEKGDRPAGRSAVAG